MSIDALVVGARFRIHPRPGEKVITDRDAAHGGRGADCSWCHSAIYSGADQVAAWVAKHEQEPCTRSEWDTAPQYTDPAACWLWSQAQGRSAPLAAYNDGLVRKDGCPLLCVDGCAYGECYAPRTMEGCGGCCGCLGGCQVEHELQSTAPHIWEGDGA